jgi:hypothetical protein
MHRHDSAHAPGFSDSSDSSSALSGAPPAVKNPVP